MSKQFFIFIFTALPFCIFSQINGVTEFGDQVVLYDDGTWVYINQDITLDEEIKTNPNEFTKSDAAKFLLKSNIVNIGVWLNAKEWKFSKAINNEDGEYELVLKNEDLYGTIITEKIEIPLKSLREIALSNARDVAPDTNIENQEYRKVNGIEVLMLEMSGTLSGINFGYKGYYYSNESGTVQMILYSAKNLMKSYDAKIETLLNGLVEVEKE